MGIYDKDTDNYEHKCAGSIVNRNFVLTAAHCIDHSLSNNFILLFGTADYNDRRVGEYKFIDFKRKITHPKYNASKFIKQ